MDISSTHDLVTEGFNGFLDAARFLGVCRSLDLPAY